MIKKLLSLLIALALVCAAALAEDPFGQEAVEDEMYNVDAYAVTEGLPDDWLNILLLGSDRRTSREYGDTDGMVILSLNLARKQAKLTSLMRDMWVTMDGRSKSGKLSSACAQGGPELAMRTVNECFGTNIQYFALVNLSGMAEIIDRLGGLDMDVTLEEMDALNLGLFDLSPYSGMERLMEYGSDAHLNGNQATAYARIRRIDSDYKRVERGRYVLTLLARRIQKETPDTIVGVVMGMLGCVETNLDMTQLMTIAAVGLDVDLDHIAEFRLPAEDTYQSGTYTFGKQRVWCIRPDFTTNARLLHEFIYGAAGQTGN